MDIKVLGTGCANCKNTVSLIDQVAREKGVAVKLEKVEELRAIMGYGVTMVFLSHSYLIYPYLLYALVQDAGSFRIREEAVAV